MGWVPAATATATADPMRRARILHLRCRKSQRTQPNLIQLLPSAPNPGIPGAPPSELKAMPATQLARNTVIQLPAWPGTHPQLHGSSARIQTGAKQYVKTAPRGTQRRLGCCVLAPMRPHMTFRSLGSGSRLLCTPSSVPHNEIPAFLRNPVSRASSPTLASYWTAAAWRPQPPGATLGTSRCGDTPAMRAGSTSTACNTQHRSNASPPASTRHAATAAHAENLRTHRLRPGFSLAQIRPHF
ncbi:hypothetical protein BKA56DRAFT_616720 [Ilyonectria sp. MPI-CAGE-AT-0026]|nr:hypothetical protein BKA56DRAFT_616720 [Ilyonectria sp. MPI-CAGE-AT-0026]